ncbi:hypothetical protein GOODEAATRI_018164 [Goodea atripinnis]|uniref:Uncharacterized protein n=1 Tax=Goodea atripinnis TaxID=208336 RepID=A0ABV0NL70_9TELE
MSVESVDLVRCFISLSCQMKNQMKTHISFSCRGNWVFILNLLVFQTVHDAMLSNKVPRETDPQHHRFSTILNRAPVEVFYIFIFIKTARAFVAKKLDFSLI